MRSHTLFDTCSRSPLGRLSNFTISLSLLAILLKCIPENNTDSHAEMSRCLCGEGDNDGPSKERAEVSPSCCRKEIPCQKQIARRKT